MSASTEPLHESARTDELIGLTLANRFHLDRLIGTGGMAAVYEAADTALGRSVAVKLFHPQTAPDAGPQRQSGEVMVLASLNHFALVTLFDAGTEMIAGTHRTFIVMEFVDGSDLRSRIAEGPIAPGEVARMGADLCEALHYVHAQGIVHRDIKPANVLLAPSDFPGRVWHAKLADFGIARLFDATHPTVTGALMGTAGYLSPEQALGQPTGPASDVYSLGLVLLESLTGERSFPGTAVESAIARLNRQPEVPAWLGADWCELLAGMTARDPDDRLLPADAAMRLLALVPGPTDEPEDDADQVIVSPLVDPGVELVDEPTAVLSEVDRPAGAATPTSPPDDDADTDADADAEQTVPAVAAAVPATTTAAVAEAPIRSRTRPRPRPHQSAARTRRRTLVLSGVVGAFFALASVLFLVPRSDPAPAPPAYPAVGGELGEHLEALQESVIP